MGFLIYLLFLERNFENTAIENENFRNENIALENQVDQLVSENNRLKSELADCTSAANTVDCNATVQSGGQGFTRTQHNIGSRSGVVEIIYDAMTIPDEFNVFYDGQLVASSSGLVSGQGSFRWNYNAQPGKPDYCIVEVSAPQNNTEWEYLVNCP